MQETALAGTLRLVFGRARVYLSGASLGILWLLFDAAVHTGFFFILAGRSCLSAYLRGIRVSTCAMETCRKRACNMGLQNRDWTAAFTPAKKLSRGLTQRRSFDTYGMGPRSQRKVTHLTNSASIASQSAPSQGRASVGRVWPPQAGSLSFTSQPISQAAFPSRPSPLARRGQWRVASIGKTTFRWTGNWGVRATRPKRRP